MAQVDTPQEIEDRIQSTPMKTSDPYAILPKEIYLEIFNKLDSPSDKENFMNTHIKFYDLFKAERVKFLFWKVFDNVFLDNGTPETDEEEDSNQKFLRLRLVCRDWDEKIQNYFQLHLDLFQFRSDEWMIASNHLKGKYVKGYWKRRVYFTLSERLEKDLREFVASRPPSKNPFLTRMIIIHVQNWIFNPNLQDDGIRSRWNQIDTLFRTFGQHLWHFSFGAPWNNSEKCVEMFNWLRLMPELSTLQIMLNTRDLHKITNHDQPMLSLTEWANVPLPEMKELQNLHVSNVPSIIFNKLLDGMKFVDKLEVGFENPPDFMNLQGYQLPTKLVELSLTLTGSDDFEYLKSLEPLPLLRKLIINIEPNTVFSSWPEWKSVWITIEEKFPALEVLHLSLPKATLEDNKRTAVEQSLNCRLNLKKLKRMSVILPNLVCLDFLQEMKGLQQLKIHLEHPQDTFDCGGLIQNENVQFNRDLSTMWESNIWQLFPNLIWLCIYVFERKYGSRQNTEIHSYEKEKDEKKVYNKMVPRLRQSARPSFALEF